MARIIKTIALVSLILTGVFAFVYSSFKSAAALSIAISCGTTAYHFCMRLLVGTVYDLAFHNNIDHRRKWFAPRKWEAPLYRAIKVKKWKGRMPSYAPENFDPERHSLEEIAGAMCQAELVHETIAVLSLLPIAAVPFWGEFAVFFVTSLGAAAFDMAFAVMQRYNRPRIIRLADRKRRLAAE